jgi:dTDP-4-dehydrorhamnose reductase
MEGLAGMTGKSQKPKILVTGCNGLLGQKVVALTRQRYWTVGADLPDESLGSVDEYLTMDISKREEVLDAVERISPVGIVNTAALTNVDACEKDRDLAWAVNVDGVRFLLQACQRINSSLIQISSDYVFDGEDGPYGEDAVANPLGFYGLTKLESERVLVGSRSPWAVVRTNVIYGWARSVRPNFVLWVRAQLAAGKYIRTAIDQYGNPTLAENLAQGIMALLRGGQQGIFHIAGADYVSRWTFALMIARVFGLDEKLIAPVLSAHLSQQAPRPHWGGLRIDRAARELGISILGVQAGLNALKEQIPLEEMEVR